jgi:hypothetical protein
MNKGYKPKARGCKDKDGKVINSIEGVVRRWQEHFSTLLNKDDLNMEEYETQQQLSIRENYWKKTRESEMQEEKGETLRGSRRSNWNGR